MTSDDGLPAGWLTQFRRGFVSGFVLLVAAVLLVAIPTFLAWLAPGADSTSAGSALRAALLITLAGNHGGVVLDGTAFSLTPLLITAVLCRLVVTNARKVEGDIGFAGLVVGYPTAVAIATHWARLGSTRVPFANSVLAALLLVGIVGAMARFGPASWQRMTERWRSVARAGAGVVATYLGCGAVLGAAMLTDHFTLAGDLQGRLMSGTAGLPIALLGVAAVPNAVLYSAGFLSGAGFDIGAHTHIAPLVVHRGTLPAFPLLAAMPDASARPSWIGWSAVLVTAVFAGIVCHRLLAAGRTDELAGSAVDRVVVAVGSAAVIGLLGFAATGGVGAGSLHHVGVTGWLVAGCVAALVGTSSLAALGISALRRRVESDGLTGVLLPFSGGSVDADEDEDDDRADDQADDQADYDADDQADDDEANDDQAGEHEQADSSSYNDTAGDTADDIAQPIRRLRSTG